MITSQVVVTSDPSDSIHASHDQDVLEPSTSLASMDTLASVNTERISTTTTSSNTLADVTLPPTVSFADVAASEHGDGFQVVRRNVRKAKQHQRQHSQTGAARPQTGARDVIHGTAQGAASLRGVCRKPGTRPAQTKGGVFVSRLSPSTTMNNLQDYVFNKTKIRVRCFELKSRHDSYKSFRILVSDEHKSKLLIPVIWPQHVVVRPFFDK